MSEWQDISTAPQGALRIDLWVGGRDGYRVTDAFWHNGKWMAEEDGCAYDISETVTHWMLVHVPEEAQ